MRNRFGQAYETQPVQTTAQNGSITTGKEIPFDYVATFTLEGRRGNRVRDVINISVEGAFVAVAIGYSFIPARIDIGQPAPTPIPFNISPFLLALTQPSANQPGVDQRLLAQCLLTRLCGINFKYSIVDSATGRELQNKPIHNIAGLGESSGERPFRPMPKPMRFEPRSTIRIEIEEISEGPIYGYDDASGKRIGAELFIVLHGYKMLGVGVGLS